MSMSHPYQTLPSRAFWRSGTTPDDDGLIPDLYIPKFHIDAATRIATAGSCFAQHIGRALRGADCAFQDVEPPLRRMPADIAHRFGYGIYSARYGNIYTTRQLREFLQEVENGTPDPRLVWQRDDRFFDALRPGVEPEGLASASDVMDHRSFHLNRVARLLGHTDVFIFTLGLTEAWIDGPTGRTLPVCPGVIAGRFDPDQHRLHSFTYAEIIDDLTHISAILRQFQPDMRLILTVSPVPLTATAQDLHVLTATTGAKATLRAAAGQFVQGNPMADYFPAYEIVTSPVAGGPWFEPDQRSVSSAGVDRVMRSFLRAHGLSTAPAEGPDADIPEAEDHCEDILLQAFAP